MPQCYVQTCGNYYSKTRNLKSTDSSVMYHVFPSSRQQALLWASLARGEDVKELPTNGRICSWHFSDINYQRDLQHELLGLPKRKKLIANAVPDRLLPPEGNKLNKFHKKNSENGRVKRANNRKTRKKTSMDIQEFEEITIKQELLQGPEEFCVINDFFSNSLGLMNYIKSSDSDIQTSTPVIKSENIEVKKELIENIEVKKELTENIEVKKELIYNSVSDLHKSSQDERKRNKNGMKMKSDINKKSISYPIRSSIRIAKKKSLLAENQTKDIAFTPKEKTGRESFAFKIKYMAKLNLEYREKKL